MKRHTFLHTAQAELANTPYVARYSALIGAGILVLGITAYSYVDNITKAIGNMKPSIENIPLEKIGSTPQEYQNKTLTVEGCLKKYGIIEHPSLHSSPNKEYLYTLHDCSAKSDTFIHVSAMDQNVGYTGKVAVTGELRNRSKNSFAHFVLKAADVQVTKPNK